MAFFILFNEKNGLFEGFGCGCQSKTDFFIGRSDFLLAFTDFFAAFRLKEGHPTDDFEGWSVSLAG